LIIKQLTIWKNNEHNLQTKKQKKKKAARFPQEKQHQAGAKRA